MRLSLDSRYSTDLRIIFAYFFRLFARPTIIAGHIHAKKKIIVEYLPRKSTKKYIFPVPVAPENLVSRNRLSRPASACSFSALWPNLVLSRGIPPTFCD